jgi:hypothetical protein
MAATSASSSEIIRAARTGSTSVTALGESAELAHGLSRLTEPTITDPNEPFARRLLHFARRLLHFARRLLHFARRLLHGEFDLVLGRVLIDFQ